MPTVEFRLDDIPPKKGFDILLFTANPDEMWDGNQFYFQEINYCPVCGRNLHE